MKRLVLLLVVSAALIAPRASAQRTLTLEESKQLALQNNARSKTSRLELEAAQQKRNSALTSYFPSISANGLFFSAQQSLIEMTTKGGNLPVYDGNPAHIPAASQFAYFPSTTTELLRKAWMGSVNVVQPVFMGGRILNGNKLAALGVEASTLQDKLAREETLLRTEEQYWLIVTLSEKARTLNKYEELLKSLLRQVEDGYRSGVALKNDVLKVRLKLNEVLLRKSRLGNARMLATMGFCQHIGLPYDSALVLRDSLSIPDIPQSHYVDKNEALPRRAEFALLERSVEAEHLRRNLTLGEYLPSVAVGISGLYFKIDEADPRTLGMAFGTISVPISDWWGGAHRIEEQSIREEIAETALKNSSELLLLQIEKAWQDLNDSYKQVLLNEEAKAQAEENVKLNQDSYSNGLTTLSDLLDAQASFQLTNDQLTDARGNYRVSLVKYLQATGR